MSEGEFVDSVDEGLATQAGPESEVTDRHDEHVTVDLVSQPSGAFDGGVDESAVAVTVADRHEKHIRSMTLLLRLSTPGFDLVEVSESIWTIRRVPTKLRFAVSSRF